MTTVEDRLREAAAALESPDREVPPFRRARQRVRRRRLTAIAAVAVALGGIAVVTSATRGGSDRVFVANPGSTQVPPTPTTTKAKISIVDNNGKARPRDYPFDLVGDAPPIAIDHIGKHAWTSPVVLPFAPGAMNGSSHADDTNGTAGINVPEFRMVKVPGGYSLRVTFTVFSFTGSPTVRVTAHANGPEPTVAPKGFAFIPNVVGLTQADATEALTRAGLAVVVAVGRSDAAARSIVLSQSPIPGVAARKNYAVTITVSAP